jgi:homoserine dehydrogenase
MGEVQTRYHISLDVADRPGVLATVATVFAAHDVSIDTVRQQPIEAHRPPATDAGAPGRAALVIVTHTAPDAALAATVEDLAELDVVDSVASVMRVEGEN